MSKRDVNYWFRETSGTWYFRLKSNDKWRSTGVRGKSAASRSRAEQWVRDNALGRGPASERAFRDYAEPFFDWERCPRIRRRLTEGKRIGKTHARTSRLELRNHVLPDPFAELLMGDIRRGDVVDLRDRLSEQHHPATVHKTLAAVKAVLSEAFYREDIASNPGAQVGSPTYYKRERGALERSELARLFSEIPSVWGELLPYCVFNTAARTGMRAGELLALKWDAIDFVDQTIHVHRAWQGNELADQVKSLKRVIPVSDAVLEPLASWRDESLRTQPDDLVFCYEIDGHRLGDTWWRKHFAAGLDATGGVPEVAPFA
tara:strand:- start:608 stop:1558 length:951 start_codon:yes stop_codon:yes gene_type:complete